MLRQETSLGGNAADLFTEKGIASPPGSRFSQKLR
jgi:hypothetical protein